jgi:glycosyltransferase involved in cell wall biosynthesis
LDIGPPDFVDTDLFFPMGIRKEFDGIQISNWSKFKRHELFVSGAALIKDHRFVKVGHFVDGGSPKEVALKKSITSLASKLGANIIFPYPEQRSNDELVNTPKEVNELINKCKMGILTTAAEGINRFKMECMATDIPVLVPADVSYPTKKHIHEETGCFFEPTPEGLVAAVKYVELNYDRFSPRAYVLRNTGHKRSLKRLVQALNTLSAEEGGCQNFDDIYWDGRNQNLRWGKAIFEEVKESITKVRIGENR